MQLTAKLIKVLPPQTGEGRNGVWKRNSIVVETLEDRFPRKIFITFWGDNKVDESILVVGNVLTVYFELESREYNERWYTDVRAWKIEMASATSMNPSPMPQVNVSSGIEMPAPNNDNTVAEAQKSINMDTDIEDIVDDLPF